MSRVTTLKDKPGSAERHGYTTLNLENPNAASVATARAWLRTQYRRARRPLGDADLILSELVTNAVLYARPGAPVGIAVRFTPEATQIAVIDTPAPGAKNFDLAAAAALPADGDAEHGRGLYIAAALADLSVHTDPDTREITVIATIHDGETR